VNQTLRIGLSATMLSSLPVQPPSSSGDITPFLSFLKNMFRLTEGPYAGRTLEEGVLRDVPYLYRLAEVSRKKAIREELVQAFDALRQKLHLAQIHTRRNENARKRRAKWLTLPQNNKGQLGTTAYFWCDDHDPWEKHGISQKFKLKLTRYFSTTFPSQPRFSPAVSTTRTLTR
jgi:hypothetical protein